jgi:hypothetical protein
MNRLAARAIKLEARSRNDWRSYIGQPATAWPDEALLGFLGERLGRPQGHEPTEAELQAIAAGCDCER